MAARNKPRHKTRGLTTAQVVPCMVRQYVSIREGSVEKTKLLATLDFS